MGGLVSDFVRNSQNSRLSLQNGISFSRFAAHPALVVRCCPLLSVVAAATAATAGVAAMGG